MLVGILQVVCTTINRLILKIEVVNLTTIWCDIGNGMTDKKEVRGDTILSLSNDKYARQEPRF